MNFSFLVMLTQSFSFAIPMGLFVDFFILLDLRIYYMIFILWEPTE